MSKIIRVTNQTEFEKALKANGSEIHLADNGIYSISTGEHLIIVDAGFSPTVVAWGSSSPTVEAWESSSPRVVARESSSPRVVAWGSSSPRVVAWGSSSPTVEARGSSSPRVVAWESSSQRGSVGKFAVIVGQALDRAKINIPGLIVLPTPKIETASDWCDYYGVSVEGDIAILYKAVGDDYRSHRGFLYQPGTRVECQDWDGGKEECGGGLHFSPSPGAALNFNPDAKRFMACPVALADIVVHKNAEYPAKIKAQRSCGPCLEVDIDGNRIEQKESAA